MKKLFACFMVVLLLGSFVYAVGPQTPPPSPDMGPQTPPPSPWFTVAVGPQTPPPSPELIGPQTPPPSPWCV